jgi:hypothetical protein
MKKLLLPACFGLLTIHFVSCSCKGTVQCGPGSLFFKSVGFTIADIDSMRLVTYVADNNFDQVVDTETLINNNGFGLSSDTCYFDWAAPVGRDYRIIFPTVGRTYSFTNLTDHGPGSQEEYYKCEEGSPNGAGCNRTLTSYTENGQAITTATPVCVMIR